MSVWYDKRHYMNVIGLSLQYGTSVLGVEIVKLAKPHVFSVSNVGLLYAQYLMPTLCAVLDVMWAFVF